MTQTEEKHFSDPEQEFSNESPSPLIRLLSTVFGILGGCFGLFVSIVVLGFGIGPLYTRYIPSGHVLLDLLGIVTIAYFFLLLPIVYTLAGFFWTKELILGRNISIRACANAILFVLVMPFVIVLELPFRIFMNEESRKDTIRGAKRGMLVGGILGYLIGRK